MPIRVSAPKTIQTNSRTERKNRKEELIPSLKFKESKTNSELKMIRFQGFDHFRFQVIYTVCMLRAYTQFFFSFFSIIFSTHELNIYSYLDLQCKRKRLALFYWSSEEKGLAKKMFLTQRPLILQTVEYWSLPKNHIIRQDSRFRIGKIAYPKSSWISFRYELVFKSKFYLQTLNIILIENNYPLGR